MDELDGKIDNENMLITSRDCMQILHVIAICFLLATTVLTIALYMNSQTACGIANKKCTIVECFAAGVGVVHDPDVESNQLRYMSNCCVNEQVSCHVGQMRVALNRECMMTIYTCFASAVIACAVAFLYFYVCVSIKRIRTQ